MNCLNAEPNVFHNYLVNLEEIQKLRAVITQNIDGLHEKTGSKNVINLHGTIYKNYCTTCGNYCDYKIVFNSNCIPKCKCGGIIKPDVVLFEDVLNKEDMYNVIKYISTCDLLIIAGTSLSVYPASGFICYY